MKNKKYPQSILNQVIQANRKDFTGAKEVTVGIWIVFTVIVMLVNFWMAVMWVCGTVAGILLTQAHLGSITGLYFTQFIKQIKDNPELAIRVADAMQTEKNPIPPVFGAGDQKAIITKRKELGEDFHDTP